MSREDYSAVFLFILFLFITWAQEVTSQTDAVIIKKISESTKASLLQGLHTDNNGLQSSCAYWLGECKVTEAVIPLQKLLRTDESEGVRISAALALYKICTPFAINAVKQAAKFDDSERVKRIASVLYKSYSNLVQQNRISEKVQLELAGK